MKNNELSAIEFMRKLGLKKNTFYKVVKEYEQKADESCCIYTIQGVELMEPMIDYGDF